MAPAKQRAKRLTPRFIPSRNRWCVDLPEDMNAGHRGRKFFKRQDSAFRFISRHMAASRLSDLKARVERYGSADTIGGLVPLYLGKMELDGHSADGIKQAKTCLRRFVLSFGDLSPDQLTADDIGDWLARPVSYTHLTLPTKRIV